MTKIVQIAGGTADSEDVYVGPERELRADMSNKELRLHDGGKQGGHKFLSRDANDQRYQQKSPELAGIKFAAAARGFMARIGDGVYRLRRLVGVDNQVAILHSDGVNANPQIGLTMTQVGEHEWLDQQIFRDVVEFSAGANGNLAGDTTGTHTGNVIGDVEGNVTGNLTGDTAGTHTGTQVGDVDVRGKTFQADAIIEFAMLTTAAKTAIVDMIRDEIEPVGVAIKLYIGTPENVPEGWAICDGTQGTPDFRDRIPMGASSTFGVLSTKGSLTHTHTGSTGTAGVHSHGVTVAGHTLTTAQIPSHHHNNGVVDKNDTLFNHGGIAANPTRASSIDGNSSAGVIEGLTTATGGGEAHTHAGSSTDAAGAHTHSVTTNESSHIPPVVGVHFIMRIS